VLLFGCLNVREGLSDFFLGAFEVVVGVRIRLYHGLGVFIVPLELFFPALLFLNLAGLFLPPFALLLLTQTDFLNPTLFFCLHSSLFFGVEVESIGASFVDDDLSCVNITSSESLITKLYSKIQSYKIIYIGLPRHPTPLLWTVLLGVLQFEMLSEGRLGSIRFVAFWHWALVLLQNFV
jgi:hypothetical protein